jgi:hypothetical protein
MGMMEHTSDVMARLKKWSTDQSGYNERSCLVIGKSEEYDSMGQLDLRTDGEPHLDKDEYYRLYQSAYDAVTSLCDFLHKQRTHYSYRITFSMRSSDSQVMSKAERYTSS